MRVLRELSAGVRLSLPVQVGLLVAAAGIVLDQATKELAESWLATGEYAPWLGEHVGWQLVYNPGGAFGLPAPSWLFGIVTILVVGIVARTLPSTHRLLPATAYGLLLAGALGNMVDRVLRAGDGNPLGGHVVDFVAWGSFPRFNVADSAITVGFVLLVVALWLEERSAESEQVTDGPAEPDTGVEGSEDHAASLAGESSR